MVLSIPAFYRVNDRVPEWMKPNMCKVFYAVYLTKNNFYCQQLLRLKQQKSKLSFLNQHLLPRGCSMEDLMLTTSIRHTTDPPHCFYSGLYS